METIVFMAEMKKHGSRMHVLETKDMTDFRLAAYAREGDRTLVASGFDHAHAVRVSEEYEDRICDLLDITQNGLEPIKDFERRLRECARHHGLDTNSRTFTCDYLVARFLAVVAMVKAARRIGASHIGWG
jgi:hypothetical protein